ncbi:PQQ-dependent sugar dehydrogenase [Candidatus Pelagibacter sp.]|nr:PQQ-dependent sugar dehydrogenase [Candidatus Pelagibacter sp.]
MKKFLIFSLVLSVGIYLIVNNILGTKSSANLKNKFTKTQKIAIKKNLFPYKYITELEDKIVQQKSNFYYHHILLKELAFKKSLENIIFYKTKSIPLSNNNLELSKYKNLEGFHAGIWVWEPGSGYLEFYNKNLFVLSSRGILGYGKIGKKEISLKQIKHNLNDFINEKHFMKKPWFSIKDLHIHNNKIFVSFTDEIKEDCWNTSLVFSELNYQELNFKKLFTSEKCIHSKKNNEKVLIEKGLDGEFNAHQSGGRILSLNDDEIFFSTGGYRSRHTAQDINSINGKILKINILTGSYKIIAMGLRNPQGLLYDKKNNFLLETEHGPKGGDEINLIHLDKKKIQNYGWAIASYGKHVGGNTSERNENNYKKYPLLKSHKDNGFIEPLKYFVPSIGISQIVRIGEKSYISASMRDKSIYTFNLDNENQIQNFKRIEIGERVRDMIYKENNLILFLESTASIGIIDLNNFSN